MRIFFFLPLLPLHLHLLFLRGEKADCECYIVKPITAVVTLYTEVWLVNNGEGKCTTVITGHVL